MQEYLASLADPKQRIAARVARELSDGDVVNLGIGLPTLVADHIPAATRVFLHSENGMMGVGPSPAPGQVNPNLVNAGKLPVTEMPGAAYFSSDDSFAMIRGGHVDVAVLGILQVDEHGRIANWAVPNRPVLGVGGAMDLLAGARKVIVATNHTTGDGQPKLVRECRFPLSGDRPADLIVTELAVFRVVDGELVLTELMPGVTAAEVAAHTEAIYRVEGAFR
jgi:3-oxoacid CoA-transferase B subunit